MKIPKYGMRSDTIRRLQHHAKGLRRIDGTRARISDALLRTGSARNIGYAAIMAAAVHSSHEMRSMLKGSD